MANTWVISDTHFRHEAILTFKDYAGKPPRDGFESVDHMDQVMMDNWNDTVKPEDTIYHLGDVLFGHNKVEWMEENFTKLNGTKHLILGNHDNPKFLSPFFKSISLWKDMDGLILSHAPLHPSTLAESHRFGTNPVLNVHGHIHSNPSPEGPYKCVSVEQTDYKPVNLDELRNA
jgi:calcineurin-like phosphoesterase family protein